MVLIYQEYREWTFQKTTMKSTKPLSDVIISKIQHHYQYRKFLRVLEFIHQMGIVEANQLFVLFGLTKAERDYLTKRTLLVAQKLVCKDYTINTYTLHRNAMYIIPNAPKRVDNYWLSYEVENILQILTSIEFYILFSEGKNNVYIYGNVPPFPCKYIFNGKSLNIYVLRGVNYQFEDYLRITLQQNNPNTLKRLMIICENVDHLIPLVENIEKSNLRVRIIDERYVSEEKGIEDAFFYIKNGQIIKEHIQIQV